MVIELLRIFSIVCTAIICGKLISKIKLPAILGWLIAGIVFGPYLVGIITPNIVSSLWYKVFIKFFECFAGVMIGQEIIFKKIASSGKQIIGITFVQSIGTFLFVSAVFGIVFFTVISMVSGMNGNSSASPFAIVGMVLIPFIIGIIAGICDAF